MKITIDIKKRYFLNLVLALLLTALFIITAFRPYFRYGQEEVVFTPEEGKLALLNGIWTNGMDECSDGFMRMRIAGKKDIIVEQRIGGEIVETTANYKYSRASQELTFNFINPTDGTENSIKCTFQPELSFGGISYTSLLKFLLRPEQYKDLKDELVQSDPGFFINDVIVLPIVLLLLVLAGIVICLASKDTWIPGIFTGAISLIGIIIYLNNSLLLYGTGHRLHMICYFVILFSAAAMLALRKLPFFRE